MTEPAARGEAVHQARKPVGERLYRVVPFPEADHGIFLSRTGCMNDRGYSRDYVTGSIEMTRESPVLWDILLLSGVVDQSHPGDGARPVPEKLKTDIE